MASAPAVRNVGRVWAGGAGRLGRLWSVVVAISCVVVLWTAVAFKLIGSAQAHWRSANAPHLVALVRAGAVFRDGEPAGRREPAVA